MVLARPVRTMVKSENVEVENPGDHSTIFMAFLLAMVARGEISFEDSGRHRG